MAEATIDATIRLAMDQSFVGRMKHFEQSSHRLADTNDFINSQTQLLFLGETQKVGTREAAAMQRLDADKLAGQILQQRSASDQPQTTGGKIQPVVVEVPK